MKTMTNSSSPTPSDFETQARDLLISFADQYETPYHYMHDNTRSPADQRMEARLELLNETLAALLSLHQAEVKRAEETNMLSKSERYQYEDYKRQHIQALEDYHEFGKAPVGSPERMAAYISHLSSWNLRNGAEALKEWRDKAVRRAEVAARIEAGMDKLKAAVDSIHEFVATHNGSEHSISNYLDWLREQKRLAELP